MKKSKLILFLIFVVGFISLFTMAITVKCEDVQDVPQENETVEVVEKNVEPQKSWLTTQLETNVYPFIFSLFGGGTGAGIIAALVAKALTRKKKDSDEAEKRLAKTLEGLRDQYANELKQVKDLYNDLIQAKDVIVDGVKAIQKGEKTIDDFKKDIVEQITIVSKGTEYTMNMLVELACSKAELVSEGKARIVAQQKELYEKWLNEQQQNQLQG